MLAQGYKFSWSARGVLAAGLNGARFRENSQARNCSVMRVLLRTAGANGASGLALHCGA